MIRCVIFDMDGTLYDTEKIYREGWLQAGVPLNTYMNFIGTTNQYIADRLTEIGLNAEQVISSKIAWVNTFLEEEGIPIKEGAVRALKWLRDHGIISVIATSSAMEVADKYLEATGMREYFSHVVSGFLLEHGKPEPDIFLMAAEQAGIEPSECAVVEDSFNGVRAGHAAGMYTIMVPDLIQPNEEIRSLADVVLPSLALLPEQLMKRESSV